MADQINIKVNIETQGGVKSIGELGKEIKDLEKEMRAARSAGDTLKFYELSQESLKLKKEVGDLTKTQSNYTSAISEMRKQQSVATMSMHEMRQELQVLRREGFAGKTPQEVATLKGRISELTDASGKARAEINAMAEDTLPAVVGSLQSVISGGQLVTGSLSLMGVESEAAEKLEKNMVQLIGVSQALSQIQQTLASGQMVARARTLATTVAMAAQTVATKVAAAAKLIYAKAQWAANAALAAFPITWIIAGLAAMVAAVIYVTKKWDEMGTTLKIVTAILMGPLTPIVLLIKYFDEIVGWLQKFGQYLMLPVLPLVALADNIEKVTDFIGNLLKRIGIGEKTIQKFTNTVNKVGNAIAFWKKKEEEVIETTDDLSKATDTYKSKIEALEAQRAKTISDMQHEIALMKEKGESIDSISQKERDLIELKIKNAKQELQIQHQQLKMAEQMGWIPQSMIDAGKKQFEENKKILDELDKELEIFDAKETKRRNDRAVKIADNTEKEFQEELKAAAELAVLRAETDDAVIAAKTAQLELLFELETANMDKTSARYLLLEQKKFDAITALRKEDVEETIAAYETVEAVVKDHTEKLLRLKIENAESDRERDQLELQLLRYKLDEQLELNKDDYAMQRELLEKFDRESQTIEEAAAARRHKAILDEYELRLEVNRNAQNATKAMMDAIVSITEDGSEEGKRIVKGLSLVQAGLKISETIISTKAAVMRALAELGPIAGTISAVSIGLTGAASIAKIMGEQRKIQSMGRGGMVFGPSHTQGGVLTELEGGEGIVNKRSMSNPAIRSLVSAVNVAGGGVPIQGASSSAPIAAQIDPATIRSIVKEVVAGSSSIPVNVVETDITKTQRRISVIENRTIIG